MATYQYRCEQDGLVDTTHRIGTAPQSTSCPACGRAARRLFTPPLLALADRRAVALIDRTERTREAPEVVTALPPRQRPRSASPGRPSPAQLRLPRP
jgi:putative FmdB family regulatory protein